MHTTRLLGIGDSVFLPIPPALLERLGLQSGMAVYMVVDGKRLIVQVSPRPSCVLEQLLTQCDPTAEPSTEDRKWIEARPMGSELL